MNCAPLSSPLPSAPAAASPCAPARLSAGGGGGDPAGTMHSAALSYPLLAHANRPIHKQNIHILICELGRCVFSSRLFSNVHYTNPPAKDGGSAAPLAASAGDGGAAAAVAPPPLHAASASARAVATAGWMSRASDEAAAEAEPPLALTRASAFEAADAKDCSHQQGTAVINRELQSSTGNCSHQQGPAVINRELQSSTGNCLHFGCVRSH